MSAGWVVLVLAPRRRPWAERLVTAATEGSLPLEVIECRSASELRVRVATARPVSAVIVDATAPGLDRDLLAHVGRAAPVLVVDGSTRRAWRALGATAVVSADARADELHDVLTTVAAAVDVHMAVPGEPTASGPAVPRGRLVAVCGSGGTGASTVAAGIAQGFALGGTRLGVKGRVVLADLCRRADQAMLHDAREARVGLQELVDAHRAEEVPGRLVRAHTIPIATRGYDLLVGLRQPRAWTALRPRAIAATVAGLRSAYDLVVADVEPDLEGEDETGSVDVEERHALARAAIGTSDLVVVVGTPGLHGVHALVRLRDEVRTAGGDGRRLLPVVTGAPLDAGRRAQLTAALGTLGRWPADQVLPPVFVPHVEVEEAFVCGTLLPREVSLDVAEAVHALLGRDERSREADAGGPRRVQPGSLGGARGVDLW